MASESKEQIRELVKQYADQFGVPYNFALAILEAESSYRPNVVSDKGAQGLYQLMPETAKSYGVTNPFDPEQNIRGGIEHLGVLLNTYNNDYTLAAAAYNAGEPAVNQAGGIPPFPETRNYVSKVLSSSHMTQDDQVSPSPDKTKQLTWIYPTDEYWEKALESGNYGDPQYEGIRIELPDSETVLTSEQMDNIFSEVNPEGWITREDSQSVAAAIPGLVQFARNLKSLKNPFTPWGLGISAVTGVFGGLGDFYRQSQVPSSVDIGDNKAVRIDSWPRVSITGMPYEGAPDTWQESLQSAGVAAGNEALGEFAGTQVVRGFRGAGRMLKGSAFDDTAKVIKERAPGMEEGEILDTLLTGNRSIQDVTAAPSGSLTSLTSGFSPRESSRRAAQRAVNTSLDVSDDIIRESGGLTGTSPLSPMRQAGPSIPTSQLVSDIEQSGSRIANIDTILGDTSARNRLNQLAEGVAGAGDTVTAGQGVEAMRRIAERNPRGFIPDASLSAARDVEFGAGKAFRERVAESLGASKQKWFDQMRQTQRLKGAEQVIGATTAAPARGYAEAQAMGLPSRLAVPLLAGAGGYATGGMPQALAGAAIGLPFLSRRFRSAVGQGLFGLGTAAPNPANILRGLRAGAFGDITGSAPHNPLMDSPYNPATGQVDPPVLESPLFNVNPTLDMSRLKTIIGSASPRRRRRNNSDSGGSIRVDELIY
jgi:hypothetical protein